jgi:hypothetical protein
MDRKRRELLEDKGAGDRGAGDQADADGVGLCSVYLHFNCECFTQPVIIASP